MKDIQRYNLLKIIENLPEDDQSVINLNSFITNGDSATNWIWTRMSYIDFFDKLKSAKRWFYTGDDILEYDIYPIDNNYGILMYEDEWDMVNLDDVYESKDECIKSVLSNLESSVEYRVSEINYAQQEYDETTKKLEEFKQKYTNGK